MCVALPGRVASVDGRWATVDFSGNQVRARAGFVPVSEGDYVLVHAGCILQKVSEEEALSLSDLMAELEAPFEAPIDVPDEEAGLDGEAGTAGDAGPAARSGPGPSDRVTLHETYERL